MERKIMSKISETSRLRCARLKDRALEDRVLEDSELSAVTGGRIPTQHPAKVTVPDIKLSIS
jgi:hypothetical protein